MCTAWALPKCGWSTQSPSHENWSHNQPRPRGFSVAPTLQPQILKNEAMLNTESTEILYLPLRFFSSCSWLPNHFSLRTFAVFDFFAGENPILIKVFTARTDSLRQEKNNDNMKSYLNTHTKPKNITKINWTEKKETLNWLKLYRHKDFNVTHFFQLADKMVSFMFNAGPR